MAKCSFYLYDKYKDHIRTIAREPASQMFVGTAVVLLEKFYNFRLSTEAGPVTALNAAPTTAIAAEERAAVLRRDAAEIHCYLKPGVQHRLFKMYAYHPDLRKRPVKCSLAQQLAEMTNEIHKAGKDGCEIFVAPEGFFYTDQTLDRGPISEAEKLDIVEKLQRLSYQHPNILIVAGTLLWVDSQRLVKNTVLVFGDDFKSFLEYHKKAWMESEFVHVNGKQHWVAFVDQGNGYLNCSRNFYSTTVQICKDGESAPPARPIIYLVPGSGTGGAVLRHMPGGCSLLVDGEGHSRCYHGAIFNGQTKDDEHRSQINTSATIYEVNIATTPTY